MSNYEISPEELSEAPRSVVRVSPEEMNPTSPGARPTDIPAEVKNATRLRSFLHGANNKIRDYQEGIAGGADLVANIFTDRSRSINHRNAKTKRRNAQFNETWANDLNPNQGYVSAGELTPAIAAGFVIPGAQGSLPAQALKVGAMSGGLEALLTPGTVGERTQAGLTGAVGAGAMQGVMHGAGKAYNGLRGKYANQATKFLDDKMTAMGLSPSIDELAGSGDATFYRLLNKLSHNSTTGVKRLSDNALALEKKIVPVTTRGKDVNMISKAISETGEGVASRGQEIWAPFEDLAKTAKTKVTTYDPVKVLNPKTGVEELRPSLKTALDRLYNDYPQILNDVKKSPVRERLLEIATTSPKKLQSLSVSDYNDLRKEIGRITPIVNAQVRNKELPSEVSSYMAELLNGVEKDMARWGNHGGNTKAYNAFKTSMGQWKDDVLPFLNNPMVHDLKDMATSNAGNAARRIVNETDDSLKAQVRQYLTEFGPRGGSDLFDAVDTMRAASNAIGTKPVASFPSFGTELNPGEWGGGVKKLLKDSYFGDGRSFVPNAMNKNPLTFGGVGKQMLTSAPISLGRENGEEALGGLGLLGLLGYGPMTGGGDDPQASHGSVSHQTMQGAAGRPNN